IISFFFDMVLKESLDGFTNLSSVDFTLYIHSIYMAFYNYKKEILLIYRSNLSSLLLDVLSKRFQFNEYASNSSLIKQYELSYIIGGIYNNLIFWMSRDMSETPDELTAISLEFRDEDSISLLSLR
ncbi:MAG: TetR/AcrR family transcriptional regulator, partial [Lachnoanaerobaculum saburreum]